ncbi:MAG: AMIN domain-containing protein [Gemmatimonadetes bacterium]|nr:AMIN domain-containing protein [Gemmatimonadota bacterium]
MTAILAFWTALLGAVPGPVTGLSVVPVEDRTEVVISVDGTVTHRDFLLSSPDRLVIDLLGARHALPRDNYAAVNRGGIISVRSSQFTPEVVRLVLELEAPVGYTVLKQDGEVRVSFLNPSGPFEPWSTQEDGVMAAAAAALAPPSAFTPERTAPRRQGRQGSVQGAPQARRITVTFVDTPILDVLSTFSEFASRSIVPGAQVVGLVNAVIRDQPWDVALDVILQAHGLSARELETGIIRVDNLQNLVQMDSVVPVVTRTFRINYATALELQQAVTPLLSSRGKLAVGTSTNTIVVTDVERVLEQVAALIEQLDLRIPQVTISAKIIFVNRTQLQELGVVYDLKDSKGNQLNMLNPGGRDTDGDGFIDEEIQTGTNVVSLGGASIAALGNANSRVSGATLSAVTSLILGRYTLINFIDALQSLNLSDIQAAPVLTTMDNRQASVLVGERTPLRTIDVGAVTAPGAAALPVATVRLEETGIRLLVTPHVTAGDNILLDIQAERSSVDLAATDVGAIFRTQEAQSRVLLKDGETAVIAGLTVAEKTLVREGIPFLMDIPFFGRLFRLTREQEVQRDLMILVTPHIVRDPIG